MNQIQCIYRRLALLALASLLTGCGVNHAKLANIGTANEGIVCLGDSLTHGYGAALGKDYPTLLARRLGRPVTNAGVNGDTSASALRRLGQDVLDKKPRVVIVLLGGNDVLRKAKKEETLRNMDEIVSRCVRAGAMVVLVHAKYGLFGDPYKDGFSEIAKRHKALLVTGALKNILGNPSHSSDQIHPNDAGYALLAARITHAVIPLLEAADRLK